MGILAPKIEGNEAEKKMAAALSMPWYRKTESWLTVVNILALLLNIFITYGFSYKPSHIREQCIAEAEFTPTATLMSDEMERQKFIDTYYQNCIRRFGIEK